MAATAPMSPTTPRSLPDLGPVLDFLRLIWGIDHALQRTSKQMETRLGITGPQRLVIRIVGRFPGLPAGKLAALLHLHQSTLTGILKRLEARGLLRRQADPRDGRRALLGLTPKGRQLDVTTSGPIETAIASALAMLPNEKIEVSREVLVVLRDALEAMLVPPRS
jgi:DNA-binding MarR family transcriptional regulator